MTWDEFAALRERNAAWISRAAAPVTGWLIDALALRPGEAVLDLAAGAGDAGFEIIRRTGPGVRLISSDVSPAVVEVARRAAMREGLDGIEFRVLDGQTLDLPTGSVDAIVCRWGYMLMDDPLAAFRETARVLREDGRVTLSVWATPARNPWSTIDAEVCSRLGYRPIARPTDPGQIFSLAERARLRQLAEQGGLAVQRMEAVPVEWPYTSAEHYLGNEVDRPGVRGDFFRALPAESRELAVRMAEELLEPYRAASGYVVPGETLNVLAVRT